MSLLLPYANRVVPHRWVVFDRGNSSGSDADAGHDASAWVLASARAADDGVVGLDHRAGHPMPFEPTL